MLLYYPRMTETGPEFTEGQTIFFIGNTFYGEPGITYSTMHRLFVTMARVEAHPDRGSLIPVTVLRPPETGEEPELFSDGVNILPHHVFTEAQVAGIIGRLIRDDSNEERYGDNESIDLTNVSSDPNVTTKVASLLSAQVAEQIRDNPTLCNAPRPTTIDAEFWQRVLEVRQHIFAQRQKIDEEFKNFWGEVLASS